eukprot:CAMPEP_0117691006 /NCGR_PEP_ID=MMETSP0804-20121206/25459_1 /TAXON_ID=1074897 /ORGANISM="Tetraselmis astigmatica, Strain CCMP880" /LENGTH=53 /DNA_ID=CAMNT_0005504149 /DNA_START=399 /DNA_END=557 /DNA_ORIENTATION=-
MEGCHRGVRQMAARLWEAAAALRMGRLVGAGCHQNAAHHGPAAPRGGAAVVAG